MSDLTGHRLGKYEIQAEIGRGGMGAVYRGYDPLLDRYVAVKVLAPHLVWEKEFVGRFLREARAAARLKHPHIVTIYDVGQEGDWYYFVMEYLEGQPLTEVIRQRGPLPPDEVLSILRPLAEALDYAHHQGLVHRDIKPGNVVVAAAGQVTLTDFGIARAAQETRLTATGVLVGTPEYMAPEQVRGLTVDARSDLYSLGVVAYEMLGGRVPFQAESTLALMYKVAHEPPPPICQARPDLPAGVEAVLAKAPGDRYATVSGFVEALGRALAGEVVEGLPAEVVAPLVEAPTVVRKPGEAITPVPGVVRVPTPLSAAVPMAKPVPARKRVPVWVWALGGLAVLALVVGVVRGVESVRWPVVGATPTPVVAVALATSTPRLTITPAVIATQTARPPTATPTPTRTPRPTATPTPPVVLPSPVSATLSDVKVLYHDDLDRLTPNKWGYTPRSKVRVSDGLMEITGQSFGIPT